MKKKWTRLSWDNLSQERMNEAIDFIAYRWKRKEEEIREIIENRNEEFEVLDDCFELFTDEWGAFVIEQS